LARLKISSVYFSSDYMCLNNPQTKFNPDSHTMTTHTCQKH